MDSYKVEPKSRAEIRAYAHEFRKYLKLDKHLYFPIVELLDIMSDIFYGFSYEIVDDNELPLNVHADTDITKGHIRIKESVYDGACNGEGRDRMTIAHEIGHYFLIYYCGFRLERNFDGKELRSFEDLEWQAKCFAGELLIPAHLVGDLTPEEISEKCGVSFDAAKVQHKSMRKG